MPIGTVKTCLSDAQLLGHEDWLQEQLQLEPSLHHSFYRQRVKAPAALVENTVEAPASSKTWTGGEMARWRCWATDVRGGLNMFQQQSLGFHPLGYNGVQWIIMGIKDITAPRLNVGMMLRIGPTIPSPFFFKLVNYSNYSYLSKFYPDALGP